MKAEDGATALMLGRSCCFCCCWINDRSYWNIIRSRWTIPCSCWITDVVIFIAVVELMKEVVEIF